MRLTEDQLFERYGKTYSAGEVLFEEGDTDDETYIILSGSVRIVKRMEQGDRTLAVVPADEFVGEMATLLGEPRSATAIIEEDVKLLVVDKTTFESMAKSNGKIAYKIIRKLAERIKNSNKQLEIMMFKDANRKVIYGMVNAAEQGEKVAEGTQVKISAEDLASITGVALAKVNQILQVFSDAHLILSNEIGFIISDKKKLFRFLEYLAMKEEIGEFSASALKTIISEQREKLHDH